MILDPARRFESIWPDLGRELQAALLKPAPQAALELLRVSRTEAPQASNVPAEAWLAIEEFVRGLLP